MYGTPHDGICDGKPGRFRGYGHGIRSEHWYYCVVSVDGKHCLSLDVKTDIFPPELPADHSARCGARCRGCGHGRHESRVCHCECPSDPIEKRRRGTDITLHLLSDKPSPWDTKGERKMPGGIGNCVDDLDTSALKADVFFLAHGDPNQFEQKEPFWLALEEQLGTWIANAEKTAAVEAERAQPGLRRAGPLGLAR
jgi:hypothetical protein